MDKIVRFTFWIVKAVIWVIVFITMVVAWELAERTVFCKIDDIRNDILDAM